MNFRWSSLIVISLCLLALPGFAEKKSKKEKSGITVIDEGTFGIFINRKHVASESFKIFEQDGFVTDSSTLRLQDGKPSQISELRIAADGHLDHYEWQELQPEKASATVDPDGGFLTEKITGSNGKTVDRPFMLPTSVVILEDFAFSHRELLLRQYVETHCKPDPEGSCRIPKLKYGILIPRQQISALIILEHIGFEKIVINGKEGMLSRFRMTTDGPEWSIWVDENMKIQKISIPETNTDVVRE